jgi:hypothetical protein
MLMRLRFWDGKLMRPRHSFGLFYAKFEKNIYFYAAPARKMMGLWSQVRNTVITNKIGSSETDERPNENFVFAG